uniref:Uncharacterized protein n=1 Tax=Anguilla anguilla TaxID=7936 RepID=A0A0E9V727_ANGAN
MGSFAVQSRPWYLLLDGSVEECFLIEAEEC